ncbi:g9671 [Coccomyxa elongata]
MVVVSPGRAGQENRGEKGGIDWDAEWRKAKQQLPVVESSTSTRRNVRRLQRDKIREQESLVLDVFSGENFFKVAGGLVVAILFIFIVVIGPPSR